MTDTSPEKLNTNAGLPTESAAAPQSSPPAPSTALQNAPAAVRRSMPMALSICVGLLLTALAAWFFYNLTWLLLLLYLSFVAATILEAPVHWLKNHGLRRGFAAVLVMVGGLLVIATILYFIGTGIYNQSSAVSSNLRDAPQRINDTVNGFRNHFEKRRAAPATAPVLAPAPASSAAPTIAPIPATSTAPAATAPATAPVSQDFDVVSSIGNALGLGAIWTNAWRTFEIITQLVIVFFIVLYMLVDGADHLKAVRSLLPKHTRLEATKLFNDVARAHRGWALASLANVCSASILAGAGLFFLGVPGAFILGFLAGLGELIPNIGPIAGWLPAIVLTLVADLHKFPYVLGMAIVVQTIQSYTISPQMLKFSIEMPVLVTILSVLVFGTLFGFLGILVAIPFVADMVVLWGYIAARREKDTQNYDFVNAPPDERTPMSPDNTSPSRLRKLFRRERQLAMLAPEASSPAAAPPAVPGASGLDRLEKAETRSAPPPAR